MNRRAFTRAPQTREEWLERLIDALRPHFNSSGYPLPDHVRVACGWPKADNLIRHQRAIGTTWFSATDGVPQVFLSPTLIEIGGADGVGGLLVHELVHAQVGPAAKHGARFKLVALAVGLEPPMAATTASPALQALLVEVAAPLGPYPHSPLASPGHVGGTRMLKLTCPVCGYTVRTTQKWIDVGLPFCPDGDPLEPST